MKKWGKEDEVDQEDMGVGGWSITAVFLWWLIVDSTDGDELYHTLR